jgi:predicted hotdog family 3-hydroxylacyl-ACP dehydratase
VIDHVTVFAPVADYVPHRPPVLMIEEIVEVTPKRSVCRMTIRPDCVFAIDGQVHPAALIELAAQAFAVGVGVNAKRKGDPVGRGFVLGGRECTFEVDSLGVGDRLEFRCTRLFGEVLGVFTCDVYRDGARCATIQLSVADSNVGTLVPVPEPTL